jgi:YHS domain-containing protein
MKRLVLAVAGIGMLVCWAGRLSAGDQAASQCGSEKAAQSGSTCCAAGSSEVALKCLVSGAPASKDTAVDYKGGKVYFCCSGCVPKFKEDIAKYQAKANEQLVLSGQFKQIACPLTGAKVNEATKTKVCGVEVCFCCKNCQSKVAKADPKAQCEMVFVKGFDKAFALNKETKETR